jgi:superfamily I DNA/RNA helicase
VIVAGPGSGKTRVLTHRIAHLVAECGVPPENCLAITFTRRAAGELRERLHDLLPAQSERLAIHTFHSFGLAILREHGTAVGLDPSFRIATEAERVTALAETLDLSEHKAERLLRAISAAKRTRVPAETDLAHAIVAYGRALSARNWVDFDDLVGLAVEVLGTHAAIAEQMRGRFRSIAIDEFQDVDEQQNRLMRLLAPPDTDLCVIGDPDQAIYGFRGADASCFDRFRQDYPAARTLSLARNYRSSGTIVAASAQVIGVGRPPSIAEAVRDMQARISIHVAPTEAAEAEHVVKSIEDMIGGHSFFSIDSGRGGDAMPRDLAFSDVAVLYRTDAQSAALCEAFARSGIPFKRHAHAPLADEPGARALLRALDDIDRDQPLAAQLRAAADRVPRGGDAPEQAAVIAAWQRLARLGEACGADWARFQDAVAVATEADFFDPRADRVALLTLHAAKGLEFRAVFIVGLEDGLLPLSFGARDTAAIAEERRLFYVGMTRAKDWLVLSRAQQRLWRGALRRLEASVLGRHRGRVAETATERTATTQDGRPAAQVVLKVSSRRDAGELPLPAFAGRGSG